MNEQNLLSMSINAQDPEPIGWSIAPFSVRSNLHSTFLVGDFAAWSDSLS